jgi:hypothetical protein
MSASDKLPMARWREVLSRGDDDLFTEEGINEAEAALRVFAEALAAAEDDQDALSAVRSLVVELNGLGGMDGRHGNFIETEEREELCHYIDVTLAKHGYEFEGDITEQWRDW